MAENKKKPQPTPKPSNGIPETKMQKIPPTPRPSSGIRLTANKAKRASFPKKKK